MRLLLALLFSFTMTLGFAQPENPVEWTWESKQISENEFELIYKAKIDDGWTIYSQYLENEDGPVATSFTFDTGTHFELVGKNKESDNAQKKYDKVFEMNVVKFFKYAEFTQRVKVKDFSKPITGYLTFMTCDAKKCLAPTDIDFEFSLKNSMGSSSGGEEKKEKTPEPEPKEEEPRGDLSLSKNGNEGAGGNNNQPELKTTTASNSSEPEVEENETPSDVSKVSTWEASLEKISDDEYNIILKASLIDGWYLYSQFQESEDGPTATNFEYTLGDHF